MKFTLTIDSDAIILTVEQVTQIAEMLYGCEMIERKYMGTGKGDKGSDYLTTLIPYDVRTKLRMQPLVDSEYDALKFITAAQAGK